MKCRTRVGHVPQHLRRAVLVLFPLLCSSCEEPERFPPNQYWVVEGDARPEDLNKDGLLWQPRKLDEHHWRYYPQAVQAFVDRRNESDWGPMQEAELVLAGRRWVLTHESDGSWRVTPPWQQTPAEADRDKADALELVLLIALGIGGIAGSCLAYKAGASAGRGASREAVREELAKGMSDREFEVRRREQTLADEQRKGAEWRDAAERELAEAKARLEAREAELDERRRRELVALRNAEAMLRGPAGCGGGGGAAAIGRYLRARHMKGAALGDLITATFLADRGGFVRLAWTVQVERPLPPMVQVRRDGALIRTDTGLAGEHGNHVVPGRRHLYKFQLVDDRGHAIGRGVDLEVKIPTAKAWDCPTGSVEDARERSLRELFLSRYNGARMTEEMRKECYADVKSKRYPGELEEWLLAKIDELATGCAGTS